MGSAPSETEAAVDSSVIPFLGGRSGVLGSGAWESLCSRQRQTPRSSSALSKAAGLPGPARLTIWGQRRQAMANLMLSRVFGFKLLSARLVVTTVLVAPTFLLVSHLQSSASADKTTTSAAANRTHRAKSLSSSLDLMGSAFRHERDGWVYIHLEGTPDQVGYQH